MAQLTQDMIKNLHSHGIECLLAPGSFIPDQLNLEPPCSIKWMKAYQRLSMGAFSYAVRGFFFDADIGRYTSIGEEVQIGRGDHPSDWVSTSPAFYLPKLFNVGHEFEAAADYHGFTPAVPPGRRDHSSRRIHIGHDVYIGHGAFIRQKITIGHGAIIAAGATVVKDVPPYAVVAGNPGVIKKYRIPEHLIERMLAVQWWRFAPWQLQGIDMTRPELALPELERLCPTLTPYQPRIVTLAQLGQNKA